MKENRKNDELDKVIRNRYFLNGRKSGRPMFISHWLIIKKLNSENIDSTEKTKLLEKLLGAPLNES